MKTGKHLRYIIQLNIITVFVVMMFFSCENSIQVIHEITQRDTLADVSADTITYFRSDSGRVKMRLEAPTMNRYEGNNPSLEFPDGFEAFFYDSVMEITSRIRANYGISYENIKLLEARNDVEVENYETQERLNTESLFWDQRKRIIFTRAFVKITSPDKVIFGDSLVATEGFDQRTIHNMRGTLEIEEETQD
ncbi:MAG: LPS export ABC transporter periplasmic protein LptC [Bacteroidales bacterium]|nr:LPS export ABC transporter periplasmic protein LptC [Bacteroidales bacterium]HOI32141.1 LPS export ABC transporter periplasmic protein LptC [Bacteroidales bacterium]